MANTSTRTLRLLSLLQTHKYWPGAELADRLGVSPRTVRRDIDRLRELGYPVHAQPGVEGGYQLAAGAALPPLMIDDGEAVALVAGMQAAVHDVPDGVAESSIRVLAKVIQVMPPRLRRRVDAVRTMTVPVIGAGAGEHTPEFDVLTTVAVACRDSERLRLSYCSADEVRTDRLVEPHRMVALGRRWYLVAYDLTRHDWRTLRLDRVTDPRGDGTRFRSRDLPAADAAEFVRSRLRNLPKPYRIEVVVEAPAERVRSRIGRWSTVEDIAPGRCRVRMSADTLQWPIMGLGTLDADFEVVEPPELVAKIRSWVSHFKRI
ncbi:MAG: YafY family transcriptional regulator [Nocardia sp.]|nr:YafY family transcriptional regulator [Nocardia sp.]